ncbi:HEPN/Toprim-associated domain-containing protein [Microbispora rosea]|uniref:HEPN/Toprim-associated domain-containing protein n=1 Tax=Microbispora rosea TaxID=58117 RepID=UPI0037C5A671
MSSYASIYVNDKEVFSYRNEIHPEASCVFSPQDLRELAGKEALEFAHGAYDITGLDEQEIDEIHLLVYQASAAIIRDRLDVLGYNMKMVEMVFGQLVEDSLQIYDRSRWGIEEHESYREVIAFHDARKEYYESLTFLGWKDRVAEHVRSKQAAEHPELRDVGPLELFESVDERVLLRLIAEVVDPADVFTLDVTDLEEGGWLDDRDAISELVDLDGSIAVRPPIIITEGQYDARILQDALNLLMPHLSSYIRFLDYEFGNEGGAAAVVKTLKSFAAAGITHRVIGLFDNDSAAYEAASALHGIKLPPYYYIIHYPDLELAQAYPTLGPQGEVVMDVNRLACSIELYLGRDVLTENNGKLTPVQWKGYMSKVRAYQGEILDKGRVQKAFAGKMKAARADARLIETQDWSGIISIFDAIINTLRAA